DTLPLKKPNVSRTTARFYLDISLVQDMFCGGWSIRKPLENFSFSLVTMFLCLRD
ncbi:hypothetical protein ACJX0J_008696, partial [Zea mays]